MKNGYIFPFSLKVKTRETLQMGLQLIGSFRIDNTGKNTVFILINNEGQIDSISPQGISVLGLDNKSLNIIDYEIKAIFPNIIENQENYIGKIQ